MKYNDEELAESFFEDNEIYTGESIEDVGPQILTDMGWLDAEDVLTNYIDYERLFEDLKNSHSVVVMGMGNGKWVTVANSFEI